MFLWDVGLLRASSGSRAPAYLARTDPVVLHGVCYGVDRWLWWYWKGLTAMFVPSKYRAHGSAYIMVTLYGGKHLVASMIRRVWLSVAYAAACVQTDCFDVLTVLFLRAVVRCC
uniref:Uncharacterized protein n=1 Tax=Dunaliella tertiolecta TaxID=3047 RepID=A0A7S3R3J0_DUNTE|mmetsp:Transcript_3247/g.7443  ORF Transcript_3247/g.7443 Transcript_3247/m.7443 type:complete len:114 (+) Transcript_3247:53-394(+)